MQTKTNGPHEEGHQSNQENALTEARERLLEMKTSTMDNPAERPYFALRGTAKAELCELMDQWSHQSLKVSQRLKGYEIENPKQHLEVEEMIEGLLSIEAQIRRYFLAMKADAMACIDIARAHEREATFTPRAARQLATVMVARWQARVEEECLVFPTEIDINE